MTSQMKGISWMLASAVANAFLVNTVRLLFEDYGMHPYLIVFFRNAFALIVFLPWLFYSGKTIFDMKVLRTNRMKMYWVRAIVGLTAMYFWFYSLTVVPLSVATALSFTAPLFIAILAAIFLGERYGIRGWSALIVGFCGVLVVLRPGAESFDSNALLTLVATIFWAVSGLMIKSLTRTDKPMVVAFYMVLMMTPMTLPFAIPYWIDLNMEIVLWLFALGFFANMFQFTMTKAFASTDLMVVQPFDFTRLIFVSVIAYIAFEEVIDVWTLIGGGIIVASAVYAAYREKMRNKLEQSTMRNDMRI